MIPTNMSEQESKLGQLMMIPLFAGEDPETTVIPLIRNYEVGSIILLGHWKGGIEEVRHVTQILQDAASHGDLIIAVDQEGGAIQHLEGPGFDTIPAATIQGSMSYDVLHRQALRWGSQLRQAGINMNLAPVTDSVAPEHRDDNAPVGALNRDFGLDPQGNASHAAAFVDGMHEAGVGATLKHYPGLGFIKENTDFADTGITDEMTAIDSPSACAFIEALKHEPDMVMMSSAIYPRIDPCNPAVLSSKLIDHLRNKGFASGVVISDSLSAKAMSHYPCEEIGPKLLKTGIDLLCICESTLVSPIFEGLLHGYRSDSEVRKSVSHSLSRIVALKHRLGLLSYSGENSSHE